MIASLVGESLADQQSADELVDEREPDYDPDAPDTIEFAPLFEESLAVVDDLEVDGPTPVSEAPSIDRLLKLARELEYGLIELADAAPSPGHVNLLASDSTNGFDTRLLTNALADLQDEDELGPLRDSIATAQDRPRDVDVMLDLVLRADAMASVLTERDQLKHAIELALGIANGNTSPEESDADVDDESESEPIAL
jgi:hypothetical protein